MERAAKDGVVLRLLRGEALEAVSRESQVPAHELESWKRVFLESGARGLKTRSDREERELTLARAVASAPYTPTDPRNFGRRREKETKARRDGAELAGQRTDRLAALEAQPQTVPVGKRTAEEVR
jgi:hypothetical protein